MKRIILITVMCAFAASPAMADPIGSSSIVEGSSWSETGYYENGWYYGNHYTFNRVVMQMDSTGDTFEHPAISNMSTGWTLQYENDPLYPTTVSAGGPPLHDLNYWWTFAGGKSNSLSFTWTLLNNNTVLASEKCDWTGSSWNFSEIPPRADAAFVPVPVPAAVLLGMLGLSVAGLKLRKFA